MTRELDAKVAEKIFGAKPPREGFIRNDPKYTTDAAADYLVLKHVREKWSSEPMMRRFVSELLNIWRGRDGFVFPKETFEMYEPGDYSMAALKALGEDV